MISTNYPHNIPGALEGVGFGAMAVSFLFGSQVFGRGKLQRWARWIFLGTGLSALVVFTDPLFPLPFAIVLVDLVAAFVLLTVAPVLLAILFQRSTYSGIQATQLVGN